MKYTRRFGAPIVIAAFAAFAACSSDARRDRTARARSRFDAEQDLALADRDTTAQPQLKDVPAADA